MITKIEYDLVYQHEVIKIKCLKDVFQFPIGNYWTGFHFYFYIDNSPKPTESFSISVKTNFDEQPKTFIELFKGFAGGVSFFGQKAINLNQPNAISFIRNLDPEYKKLNAEFDYFINGQGDKEIEHKNMNDAIVKHDELCQEIKNIIIMQKDKIKCLYDGNWSKAMGL